MYNFTLHSSPAKRNWCTLSILTNLTVYNYAIFFLLFLILIPLIKIIFSFEFIINTLNLELNQISVTKLLMYLPTTHRQERGRERERERERGGVEGDG